MLSQRPGLLKAQRVTQAYVRQKPVFADLDLTLEPGITVLLGTNGAGKTTLLRTIVGLLPPKRGTVTVNDINVFSRSALGQVGQVIGYLPQKVTYDSRLTVAEFIAYIGWMRGLSAREVNADMPRVLEAVELGDLAKASMGSLSGGQVQRAGVAAAIIGKPSILILDEPTVGLDPAQRVALRRFIREGLAPTTLLSTHMMEDATQVADRIVVLHRGEFVFDGDVAGLEYLAPAHSDGMSRVEAGLLTLLED